MPLIHHEEKIDVRAPADAAFAVVARDVAKASEDPNAMTGSRPLDEGPLRPGFRWCQTVVHNRKLCRTDWVVTRLEPAQVLEQDMRHYCADLQRATRGGERWGFAERPDGSTLVTLHAWRLVPGVRGWLQKLLGSGDALTSVQLRRRLAYVQFAAERSPRA
jgi:hypothetical protein